MIDQCLVEVCLYFRRDNSSYSKSKVGIHGRFPRLRRDRVILSFLNSFWLGRHCIVDQECYCVYSVNVETLKFLRMRISPQLMRLCPEQISTSKVLHLLSEVNKSLCLTFVSPLQLQMFLLKDRVNSIWTKSLTIHLHSLSNQPTFFHGFLSDNTCLVPTRGVDGGDLLDLVKVYIHHGDQLFIYDLKTQECREVGFLSKEQKLCSPYFFNSDSLISWTSV